MISFTGIAKRFGSLEVLRGVSLNVRSGSVMGLVGPNASGKTTLIKIALGLTRADEGGVRVNGALADRDGAYRANIGYMPQIARFPENLRIADLLELVGALRPLARHDRDLIASFGLDADLDRTLGTLSGGTRQKVNAAVAFLFRPQLLVLDEPTAGLDPVSSGILKDKIKSARAEGRTVVITSHVLAELEELADDVAFLCDGSLQFSGSVSTLLDATREERLEAAIASLMREGRAPAPRASARQLRLVVGGTGAHA